MSVAGPPFQTDDPQPIDFHHFEFYTFAALGHTPLETDAFVPAVEFNWGAVPNVQLHIIIPAAAVLPRRGEPRTYGLSDIETGVKFRFVQETKHRPMIGIYPMFELPTGDARRELGVGKLWFKLPIWVQKSFGKWTTYGGGGMTVVDPHGYTNFPFAGWEIQRDFGKKLMLGVEAFYHGAEGAEALVNHSATLIDVGAAYKFRNPGFQLLLGYGHSVIGASETYGYVALYWTWGANRNSPAAPHPPSPLPRGIRGPVLNEIIPGR